MKMKLSLILTACTLPIALSAQTVFNDSWADGSLAATEGTDIPWYTTTSTSALEVGTGFMGLVSGSSGRGIHGLYTPTALNVGDSLTLTYTFTTPATIGTSRSDALRVSLANSLGRAIDSNQTLSSGSPNFLFDDLPAYMSSFDIATGTEDVRILRHREDPLIDDGRFMSTTGEWNTLDDSANDGYSFAAATEYVGVLTITRSGADEMTIFSSMSQGATLMASFSAVDGTGSIPTTFDMLGFQVNSNTFGTSNSPDTADNGIDFTNINLVYTPVPEPSTYVFLFGALAFVLVFLRRRRS